MSVKTHSERRWTIDDFARVEEIVTGDEREPEVFGLNLKANPMTRKQLVALRDAFDEVLKDAPEKRIKLL